MTHRRGRKGEKQTTNVCSLECDDGLNRGGDEIFIISEHRFQGVLGLGKSVNYLTGCTTSTVKKCTRRNRQEKKTAKKSRPVRSVVKKSAEWVRIRKIHSMGEKEGRGFVMTPWGVRRSRLEKSSEKVNLEPQTYF